MAQNVILTFYFNMTLTFDLDLIAIASLDLVRAFQRFFLQVSIMIKTELMAQNVILTLKVPVTLTLTQILQIERDRPWPKTKAHSKDGCCKPLSLLETK